MIKYTSFIRFDPTLDRHEALARWRNDVGPLQSRIPGVVRCVQNEVVNTTTNAGVVEGPPGFDGFTSMWWESAEAFEDALRSPEWADATEREAALIDDEWAQRGMRAEIEERVKRVGLGAKDDGVSTPPGDPVKLVGLLRYRADMTRDEANHYWRTHHGDIALTIEEMGHYTQNHAIRPIGASAADSPGFDGYSEAWFPDLVTYEQAMSSTPWQLLVDDGPALFDMDVFVSGIVRERVLTG